MRAALFVLCLAVALTRAAGQSSHDTHFQLWLDPSVNFNLSERTRITGDLYFRTRLDDTKWTQSVVRPGIVHAINDAVTVLGGVGLFRVKDHEQAARNEIRYWAGLQYSHPLVARLEMQHYLRAEKRVFYQSGYETFSNLRLRYRLGLNYTLVEYNDSDRASALVLQYEPFLTLTSGGLKNQFFNTERAYLGVANTLTAKVRLDVYYMMQWGKPLREDHLEFTDHIVQIRFQYTINPL